MTDNRTDSLNAELQKTKRSEAADTPNSSASASGTATTVDSNATVKSSVDNNDKSAGNSEPTKRNTIQTIVSKVEKITPKVDTQTQSKAINSSSDSNNESSNKGEDNIKSIKAVEPEVKKFDIVIAGMSYAVFCPVDEEEELRAAEYYINNFTSNIKKDAPNLNQENLLVLSCLSLFEKINDQKKAETERRQQSKQTESLLNKIMQDAHSML